jgi:hypothetical protein
MMIQRSELSSRKAEGNGFVTGMAFSDFNTATREYTKFTKRLLQVSDYLL